MTSPNTTPATAAATAAATTTPRKSLTLLQFLGLIAFAGLASSLLLKQFI